MTKLKLYTSLVIYLMGTLCLVCSDFFISKNYDQVYIAEWAALKSFVFVFGGICVFGFDQVLMRNPEIYRKIIGLYLIQAILLSCIFGILIFEYYESNISLIFIIMAIFIYSINQYWAGVFRGSGRLIEAQVFTNGWKILTLILLLLGLSKLDSIILYSFIGVFFINLYFMINNKISIDKSNFNLKNSYKNGFLFFLNSISLTMATYGEQLLVNIFQNKNLSYNIFIYTMAFNSIMLLAAGFLGFYFGPKIKYIKKMSLNLYYKYLFKSVFFGLILSILSCVFGFLIFKFYLKIDYNIFLIFLIMMIGFTKVIYSLPSAAMALYCETNSLKRISLFNLLNMAFFIFSIAAIIYFNWNVDILVFLSILLHWLLRFLNTQHFVVKSLREKYV